MVINNLIIQWGISAGAELIQFPISYTNSLVIVPTVYDGNQATVCSACVYNSQLTGFFMHTTWVDMASGVHYMALPSCYIAVGY